MAKKAKVPGRRKLVCECVSEFSTHSSNRKKCHVCKPKCREIHTFGPKVVVKLDHVDEPTNKDGAEAAAAAFEAVGADSK